MSFIKSNNISINKTNIFLCRSKLVLKMISFKKKEKTIVGWRQAQVVEHLSPEYKPNPSTAKKNPTWHETGGVAQW
jgi:hypothetical protein